MSIITRCDNCGYERNNNIIVFGFTGKFWEQLHGRDGKVVDLCTLKCVSEWIEKELGKVTLTAR